MTELESPRRNLHIYRLNIYLEDAWTFIPLVYPKYDTNTNLTLESKIIYSNLFGTLVDFRMDSYIEIASAHWGKRSYSFQWIQKHDRLTKSNTNKTVEDYTYNETLFLFGTDFKLTDYWTYTAAPGLSFNYLYKDLTEDAENNFDKDPFAFGIKQNLIYNPVNWIGNFREGLFCDLSLQLRFSFFADTRLKGMSYIETAWYHIYNDRIASNLRSIIITGFRKEIANLGSYMRGVPDQNLYGERAFFLNSSFPLKALDMNNLVELQISPFMDWGLTERKDEPFSNDQDFRLSSGFSMLFFFDKLTSIQIRTSFGWDLLTSNSEEESFEFLLSTSLFY
ncbi:MAG: hypothetical protein B6241_14360 [Spirochaetaceae bacterium 4572_59]|nr:MAG: hypothetical protein B6241_14360 [Spirochaetaceae bacterium 4572_59]